MSTNTQPTIITIDRDQKSIYVVAHRNPKVPKEEALLEDYNILNKEVDNLKYLFVRPENQTDSENIKYEIKQIITGANIFDAGLLATFISTYLDEGDVLENGEIKDVTNHLDNLHQDFYVAENYADALNLKTDLEERQMRFYDSLITNGQAAIKPIELEVVDLILLIAEFTQRVILPSALDNPDRLEELQTILSNAGLKPSYSQSEVDSNEK